MASFGEELKRERELRDISLKEISEATKISVRFLEALEQDRFEVLPGGIFNRGFIRAYARFIGIDGEAMVNAYLQEVAQQQERHKAAAVGTPARSGPVFRPTNPPPRSAPPRKPPRTGAAPPVPSAISQLHAFLRGRAAWLLWGLAFVAFLLGAIVIALSLVRGNGEASPATQAPVPAILSEPASGTGPAQSDAGSPEGAAGSPEGPQEVTAPPSQPPRKARSAGTRSVDPRQASSDPAAPAASDPALPDPAGVSGPDPEPGARPADRPADDEAGLSTGQAPPTPTAPAGPLADPVAPSPDHALRLQASEITRVRVECNGRVALFQELWPGQEISLRCEAPVRLSADNGGAVTYGLDGRAPLALGEPGERVDARAIAPRPDGN